MSNTKRLPVDDGILQRQSRALNDNAPLVMTTTPDAGRSIASGISMNPTTQPKSAPLLRFCIPVLVTLALSLFPLASLRAQFPVADDFNALANDQASALAVQADGKILLGGKFTTLGGQPRYNLGRLNGDGTPDSIFNPGANNQVLSLAIQSDGKILVGGWFSTLAGQQRSRIARLNNSEPATQTLKYDGTNVTWLRGGSGPEVWRTTFEHSVDGLAWTNLGAGERIGGGWQLSDVSLRSSDILRARGHSTGGYWNGSGGIVETILDLAIRLHLVRNGSTAVLSWSGGQGPYQVQQSTDASQPNSWQDVGTPVQTNSISRPIGSHTLFLRVRGQ